MRPELWRDQLGAPPPPTSTASTPVVGPDGFTMPATQHDAVLWLSGAAYDVVFDIARLAIAWLDPVATVADETSSWPYRHDRDLTGFIDGTENPSLAEAPAIALVPAGEPGAGGSVLLLQRWAHDVGTWEALPVAAQEAAMGRSKDESVELDPRPASSHVARTDQDDAGHVFRRNMPYGTVTAHGTMFVGFAADAGAAGPDARPHGRRRRRSRDELTRYTSPETGAYYFVPALGALHEFEPPPSDDD